MTEVRTLLVNLEDAVSKGSPDGHLAALSYATDLLIAGRYRDEDTWVFGQVVSLLASEIEASARARLAHRLASIGNAPSNLIDKLASDESIEVAGPVLRNSEKVSNPVLLATARTQSQAHLRAISQRKSLPEDVTDVLVTRGDQDVVRSVARNDGARFSDSGFWHLVTRCEDDIVLTLEVGARKDIPRHHFQKLVAKASDEVKARLVALNVVAAAEIKDVVTDVTGGVQARLGPATRQYFAAKRVVSSLHRAGELTERAIFEFARAQKFEEVTVALSLLCDIRVDVVERAILDDRNEMALVLAKAAGLSWTTARLLLSLGRDCGVSASDLDTALKNFSTLTATTARKVVAYYNTRRERQEGAFASLPSLHGV